ncbi:acyl-[acyl-carrier-protein]--UDP-N-acetylglucosamine O-acyltransferase [Lutibacter agarilyticus]|uniref:Acyl-[acyl-carrier-protein]--UDP-N-acetylglucosamine O-acyltransferase n=1 Tax=Lutibacter agarilyticus TaxID=1109740 RepID=A0A238VBT3_9FLAO|nr:acyl-ACP--UDP-N-acetylglucosamine O-acyltransferase [Lutibacter agarilyticus]SNR31860.1 acyl-[acyl-carrier-protein]--UDP-N-acetylglucosamine O-acyltransferase [Lutibacter agarilyticus]
MNQPLAYIHPGAKIATNVVVEPFTTIHNNVQIGSGTWIGSNVTIMEGARIGKNCRIFPGAVISAIPQDLKFDGEDSLVIIGDNTTIRECVTVNRGTKALGKTQIGDNCLIMATSHIAHDCVIGDNCILANGSVIAGHVTVGDFAILSGLVAVHQFIHIGQHALVSGGSLVRKDVPPFTKAGKEPLSYVGINSIGLRRRGFDTEKIREIQDIYRILYQKNYNNSQALGKIEAEMEATKERDQIILFIKNSQRGIMKGYTGS